MTEKDLQKQWGCFLIDIGRSGTEVAREIGTSQQNLNKKIRNATIRYVELANILEKYGYEISIRKKSDS